MIALLKILFITTTSNKNLFSSLRRAKYFLRYTIIQEKKNNDLMVIPIIAVEKYESSK